MVFYGILKKDMHGGWKLAIFQSCQELNWLNSDHYSLDTQSDTIHRLCKGTVYRCKLNLLQITHKLMPFLHPS